MSHSRRHFLMASAALVAPQALARGTQAGEVAEDTDPLAYFQAKGYEITPSHGLIADYAFNGSLRYDETPSPGLTGKTIQLQGCSRLEDIARRGEPGVLPYFHILAYRNTHPGFTGETCSDVLDFLVNTCGLDPRKLVVVSTDRVEPLRPVFEEFGIGSDQIVLRSWDEARAQGDGSGYFAPPEHPHAPGYATASLHYPLAGAPQPQTLGYPVSGHIELGEVSIPSPDGNGAILEDGGLGVERVAMARGEVIDTYEEALIALVLALEEEADKRFLPLPDGYHSFRPI